MTTTVTTSCLCIRRTGDVVPFNADKIALAMRKAFIAVQGESAGQSSRLRDEVARLTQDVVNALTGRRPEGSAIAIEDIQDQVELALMRSGEHEVARAYVLYREARAAERRARHAALGIDQLPALHVTRPDGSRAPLDIERLGRQIEAACHGLEADTRPAALLADTLKNL